MGQSRGAIAAVERKTQRFVFIYGCGPGEGVIANTYMFRDVINHLNGISGALIVPKAFSNVDCDDVALEVSASSGKPLELLLSEKDIN
jgi:hypothetical protein